MEAKLYGFEISNPTQAVRLMLEYKGIEYRRVNLSPGLHPILLRLAGFRGGTVPAMKLDGRRVQTTRRIARALEELRPEPSLYPADPERRAALEEVERWADEDYQAVPRILTRWMTVRHASLRAEIARGAGMPLPKLVGYLGWPQAKFMAAKVDADDESARRTLERLPAVVDHVDALIAEGTIGGERLNVADFQIATTTGSLMSMADVRPLFEGRAAAEHSERIAPSFPGGAPPLLPPEWLAPVRRDADHLRRPAAA